MTISGNKRKYKKLFQGFEKKKHMNMMLNKAYFHVKAYVLPFDMQIYQPEELIISSSETHQGHP